MAIAATLLSDSVMAARLRGALRDHYLSTECESWAQLMRTVGQGAVAVAIVDPHLDRTDTSVGDPLRILRRSHSALAIVAYVGMPPTTELDLFEYGRLGLDAVIVKDRTDAPRLLRATIERAEARGLLDPIRRALGDVNPTVRDAVLMSVTRAQQRLSPDAMARVMGITRGYLASQLQSLGFPSPHQLIAWGRLIVASRMLEDERRTANGVAAALEFPSGSAFRNACQRYLAATPAEIRERGGAAYAVARFFAAAGRDAPSLEGTRDMGPVLSVA